MNEIFEKIENLREQQETAGGPFFTELSTPGVWIELLHHTLRGAEANFEAKMFEIAALALSAIRSNKDSDESMLA